MILRKRFFQGKTQMEVAEEIGISQAQVSRLEKAAIKQMNKNIFKAAANVRLFHSFREPISSIDSVIFHLICFNKCYLKYHL